MSPRPWPRTRRGVVAVLAVALVFLVLNVLALTGSAFAFDLLVSLAALVVGMALGYLGARPVARRLDGAWRLVGFAAGLVSMFALPFLGAALFGIPPFPTAEGGYAGDATYAFSFGFGLAVARNFLYPGDAETVFLGEPDTTGTWKRAAFVVGGAVAGLFAVSFLLFAFVRLVIFPLARAFG